MKALKQTLLIVLATLAVAAVLAWAVRTHGFRSMLFALLVNFLLLDWVAAACAILGPRARFHLPRAYYEPRPFERGGRIYRHLGVHWFKRLVAKGPLSVLASIDFRGEQAKLDSYYRDTLWGETVHLAMFMAVFALAAYAATRGWYDAAIYLTVWNIPINFYPVILQRYNRFRLMRVMQRREPGHLSEQPVDVASRETAGS